MKAENSAFPEYGDYLCEEKIRKASKWVTLRALRVLKQAELQKIK
ncbi:hypothetical protein ACFLYR_09390 [Chloroflexota bacterium]